MVDITAPDHTGVRAQSLYMQESRSTASKGIHMASYTDEPSDTWDMLESADNSQ